MHLAALYLADALLASAIPAWAAAGGVERPQPTTWLCQTRQASFVAESHACVPE